MKYTPLHQTKWEFPPTLKHAIGHTKKGPVFLNFNMLIDRMIGRATDRCYQCGEIKTHHPLCPNK